MCGRYTYAMTNWPKIWRDFLGGAVPHPAERTWNVAPTQRVDVVRVHPETGAREACRMVWGLVPPWAEDMSIGSRMINARAETVAEKPAFRAAFRKRRCLMLSTGFYEWQDPGTKKAQPWFIRVKDTEVFAFAAIWERWTSPAQRAIGTIETCAIITTAANEVMAPIHHRMPVILPPEEWAAWLDPARQDAAELKAHLRACPPEWLETRRVSKAVNNARNNSPALTEPEKPLPLFGGEPDGP